MRVGAATGQMDEMVGNQFFIPPDRQSMGGEIELLTVSGQMDIAKPHSIVVDQSGVRYMNECGSYMEFCQKMLKRNRQVPAVPSWWIVDEQYMRGHLFCGSMPGSGKPKQWHETGFLKRADSIADLARLLDVQPETLKAAVDRFNADARVGRDQEFHRGDRAYDRWLDNRWHQSSPTLGTIEKAPFYAAPVVPGNVGTFGGVVTDTNARVLREDSTPIPGLYATGVATASAMGRVYPGAGASIGPSFTFGYIAAKHAAGADNFH